MATDLVVYILLGFSQAVTAAWGGLVSARSITDRRERNTHIAIFAVLFVIGMGLVIWSGLRAYDAQNLNEQSQKQLKSDISSMSGKLDKSLTSQVFIEGQLKDTKDGIAKTVGKLDSIIAHPKSPEQKQAATEIKKEIQSQVPVIALQSALSDVLKQEAQEGKMRNWPYGSAGADTDPSGDLHLFFSMGFPEANSQHGTDGLDRFFLYYMLRHGGEYKPQNFNELNDQYYATFPGLSGNPVAESLLKLLNLGLIERVDSLFHVKLKEPYYSRYKNTDFKPHLGLLR